jgi:hypothetical protein
MLMPAWLVLTSRMLLGSSSRSDRVPEMRAGRSLQRTLGAKITWPASTKIVFVRFNNSHARRHAGCMCRCPWSKNSSAWHALPRAQERGQPDVYIKPNPCS